MKIRLHGTPEECQAALATLRPVLRVVDESHPYPDRPPSELVRVYLEVRPSEEAKSGA